VDVVTEIRQHPAVAIQITDGGGRRDDILESALGLRFGGHGEMILEMLIAEF